jgi:hypothetical protein
MERLIEESMFTNVTEQQEKYERAIKKMESERLEVHVAN